jgi:hypothetical protein
MAIAAVIYLLLIIAWAVTPAPVSTVLGVVILVIIAAEIINIFRGWRAGEFKY